MRLRFWLAAWMIALAAPAFPADEAPCPMTGTALRPVMATHTQPPYPEMSVMTKEEGTTLLEVAIGADGVPTDAKIVTSSGSLRLDQAAMDHVKANWRWTALAPDCKPVSTRVSILWNLHSSDSAASSAQAPPTIVMDTKDFPPDAMAKREQGTVVLSLYVLTTGQVTVSRVIQTSGFPDLDAKSAALAKAWRWSPASLDGHPVNTALVVVSVWKQP